MGSEGRPAAAARKMPPAPPHLGRDGRKLWRSLVERFDFERAEMPILEAACRQRDDITGLEELIREQGLTVEGSQGQTRLHPAVTEVRLARATLARLLGELKLPAEEAPPAGAADPAMNARSRKAQTAANRRWQNHRDRRDGIARG